MEHSDVEHLDQRIAARLSSLSTPLLMQADECGLFWNTTNASTNREHALRLAQDPRFFDTLTAFHEDWLNLFHLDDAHRDEEMYPTFSDDLVEAMRIETDLFMTEVLWSGQAKFEDLFFSRFTWVNSDLASLYGIADPGNGWHRVELDESRPGILTRSAFLAAHAYTGSSAPIKRGSFVLKEMSVKSLCTTRRQHCTS